MWQLKALCEGLMLVLPTQQTRAQPRLLCFDIDVAQVIGQQAERISF